MNTLSPPLPTGTMSRAKRTKALAEFEKDDSVSVFLISIRAGAVGINLTVANYVFIMDPSLNPALEEQAVGRVREYRSLLSYESYESYDSYESYESYECSD